MTNKNNIDYTYILAASHSGSTLLSMLLGAHPEIATIGETSPGQMGDVDTYRCSCGRPINQCLFWTRITKRMQHMHPDFNLGNFGTAFECPSHPVVNRLLRFEHRGVVFECMRDFILRVFPCWRKLERKIAERCYDLASAVLTESGAHVLVDSSKLAHRLKFLLRIPGLNIRVVHLVRDGRGVALTYMNQDEFADAKNPALRRGGRGPDGQASACSLSMRKAANEWLRCLRSAECVLTGLDRSHWIRVHYEDLCTHPGPTLDRLHRFLGVEPGRQPREFRSVEQHVVGNGMRLDTTSEIRLDERWRTVLSNEQMQIFDSVAGKMNRRYGYV